MIMMRTAFASLLLMISCAAVAAAHDFWIEPSTFHPANGSIVAIRLRVGQDFTGDPVARDSALIERFTAIDANGERPVIGHDGLDPAGLVRIENGAIIVYRSRGTALQLAPDKFEQFIRDEGLERLRAEASQPWRESFSRCAKALLGTDDRRVGMRLELIAEKTPTAGAPLPVRLEYEGKPLGGVLLTALNENDPSQRLRQRTDAHGHATLTLPRSGVWLIKAVHVARAPTGAPAPWESLWASLTFDTK